MGLMRRLPWWSKIAAKVVLARLPVSYATWRRLGLFRHSDMQDPAQPYRAFKAHLERATAIRPVKPGFNCLELGPGDTLLAGLVARTCGAERVYLVDNGSYAATDLAPYARLARELRALGLSPPPVENCVTFGEMLEMCRMVYLTKGLQSLREIPARSIDFFWSQVVLEHVPRAEMGETLRQLRRVARDDAVGSHSVDLKDHLGGGLNNLRFRERLWESEFMRCSGFYTNRLRFREFLDLFDRAGFETTVVNTRAWDTLPIPPARLAAPFSRMSQEDLRVSEFEVVLCPRAR